MKKFKFLPTSFQSTKDQEEDPTSKRDAYLRRREQVRKAQKTYRERKEEYVKSLEGQVVQLRANEANLVREGRNLRSEIRMLRQYIAEQGLQAPDFTLVDDESSYFTSGSDSEDCGMSVVTTELTGSGRLMRVRKASSNPDQSTNNPFSPPQGKRFASAEPPNSFPNPPVIEPIPASWDPLGLQAMDTSVPQVPNAAPSPQKPLGTSYYVVNLDLATIGMEFVLTLEAPCLDHIPRHSDPSSGPYGHALMAAAPLFSFSETTALAPPTQGAGNGTTWEAPAAIMDRLLNLSKNLNLEYEVSPVQAWNLLRQHPLFTKLETQQLAKLTQELAQSVTCHGFGAVVDRDTFDNVLFKAFNPSASFIEVH